jgi:outer membrane protein OmpA-like peptidoglycan-associated protein/tetratricopeptide (TPR) repeat protein
MKVKVLHIVAILLLITGNAFSQEKQIAKANKKFDNLAYIDAIATYQRVAEKGYKSAELFQKLGDSYYFNAQYEPAEKWYAALFDMDNKDIPAEYYYRYSQSLKSTGQYDKANEMLVKFNAVSQKDFRGQSYLKTKNYLSVIKSNSGRYNIHDAGINSEYADFGGSSYGNKIVFATARDTGGFFKRTHKWTNNPFTDLYVSEIRSDSAMSAPVRFSKEINSKFNESTPVFTKDGKTMYFTRNNYKDRKKGQDKNEITLLKLYKAVFKDSIWTDITELPFNNDQYNVAHPALSPDEKTLYFASDMPGSLGQSDLYKVALKEDGSFGMPENLGPKINTEGKETFPFISAENEIYFASDGHLGLGGLDVFVSKPNQDGALNEPVNVGEPVNSPADDFAFSINSDTKTGFFSSNRAGGKGMDDIYRFSETRALTCEQVLSGIITDSETGEILANAEVILLDRDFRELKKTTADENGYYTFDVECNSIYHIRTHKQDYATKEVQITTPEISGKSELSVSPEKIIVPFKIGDDIAKKLGIKKIYFDLGKSDIRPDAAVELAKILEVMAEYPAMKIDIRSHTDSRDSFKNNEKLSERRAMATMAWFVAKGIAPDRLTGKGYGETQLINNCADGVPCTEVEHQMNRRSEFIVMNM